MTTGARRGELCVLRWRHVSITDVCVVCRREQPTGNVRCTACRHDSLDAVGALAVRQNVVKGNIGWFIKDTKTHQQRRIALDPTTVAVLLAHRSPLPRTMRRAGHR